MPVQLSVVFLNASMLNIFCHWFIPLFIQFVQLAVLFTLFVQLFHMFVHCVIGSVAVLAVVAFFMWSMFIQQFIRHKT